MKAAKEYLERNLGNKCGQQVSSIAGRNGVGS